MAKSNRMASLISGIRGDNVQGHTLTPQEEKEANSVPIPKSVAEELGLSQEQEDTLNAERRKKMGRPRGSKGGTAKPREDRATFIVSKELTRKLKYISLMETKLYKNVVAEALSSYIERWETKNGKINLPKSNEL